MIRGNIFVYDKKNRLVPISYTDDDLYDFIEELDDEICERLN